MAKLYKGNIDFGLVLNQTGPQPIDSRSVVQSYEELLKSDTFGTAIYNGMTVATINEQKVYMLVDKTKATSEDGWKEIGAGSGSLAIENFTITSEGKIAEATADNIGQIIYVTGGTSTHPAGPYIVIADGEVSKLGTTTATGDIAGDVESLKTRVTNVETNKADLTGLTALETTVASKVDNTTFVTHSTNAEIHVTVVDKAKWNNASDASSTNTSDIAQLKLNKADASALTESYNTLSGIVESNYNTLNDLISSETTTRENAITSLTESYNTLSGIVESNYNTLNDLISSETTTRENAITSLTEVVNTKASNDDLTAHTNNETMHITADERTNWNQAKEDIDAFLTSNKIEGAIDTLKEIQGFLSGDTTGVSDMLSKISSAQTTANSALTNANTAQNEIDALELIVNTLSGKVDTNISNIETLSGAVEDKLTKLATVNNKSFDENGALVIDSADIKLNEEFGEKLVDEVKTARYTTDNTVQYVLKDIDVRIDAINTTIDNVTGGGVIADITAGDGINVDKTTKTTPTISVNTDGSTIVIDSNKKVMAKVSTTSNNALNIDENGLYVQAITIDGTDVEV